MKFDTESVSAQPQPPPPGAGAASSGLPVAPRMQALQATGFDQPVILNYTEGWLLKTHYSIEATTEFIKVSIDGWGRKDIQVIPTHRITGVEYGYRSWPILLLFGTLLFLFATYLLIDSFMGDSSTGEISSVLPGLYGGCCSFIIGILLVGAYLYSRKQGVTISSEDRRFPLTFNVEGVDGNVLIRFIQHVETKYTSIRTKELE